nr:tRNA (guanosine(46)-N7)-methyltransferase TrmB [uncultured Mediterraneibacter sp.]
MRLRNIPRAEGTIQAHSAVIKRPEDQKGCWGQVFGNRRPIRIEIGMGKGRFILNMAKQNPEINFIGIERYSSVLLRAIEKFDTDEFKELKNIRFVCMDARKLEEVFAPGEVDRIYLNFSDPWPKARHAKRRLTSTEFLERYEQVLIPYGAVEFKTDNTELFNFSLEQIKEADWTLESFTYDLHHNEEMSRGNVMTEYEEKFSSRGNPINKLIAVKKEKNV